MQVHARAVDQADDGCIDMPVFVGSLGSDPDLGLGGVDPDARSTPAALSDEPSPGDWMYKHATDPLGVERQCADVHVTVVGGLNHIAHPADLLEAQPTGPCAWTARTIVERASGLPLHPRLVARWLEAEKMQRMTK